jgi:hypothetical protein
MCAGVIDAIWAAVVLQPLAQPGSRLTAAVRITIVDRRSPASTGPPPLAALIGGWASGADRSTAVISRWWALAVVSVARLRCSA